MKIMTKFLIFRIL